MSNVNNNTSLVWQWAAGPIESDVVRSVERQWGIQFPQEYVECVQEFHGGRPSLECFDFPRRKEAVLNHLLGFVDGADLTITQVYDSVKDRLPDGVFPFADDPFGNLICFDYRNATTSSPSVVFWDHEVAFSDRERATSHVTNSFNEFVNMLYNPVE